VKIEQRYYLGIDAGGSKTHAIVVDQTGAILGAGRAGTGNWESAGLEGAEGVYAQVLRDALEMAGLHASDLCAAGYGLAGVDWPSDEQRLRPVIQTLGVPGPHALVNDAFAALRAGSDENCGVAVISGTGVTVAGRNREGERLRTFALGNQWGDFGSASDIVRLATRAIAYSHLSRGPKTLLTARFVARFGARDVPDMVERITRGQAARPDGRLAPLVFATAAEGDAVARRILVDAAYELGYNTVAIARRLWLLREPFDLVLAGGVFRAGFPLFRDSIVELVQSSAPLMRPVTLGGVPVVGAALLAMDAAGEEAGADVRRRLVEEAGRQPLLAE